MKINLEYEISELMPDLKSAKGYLECEWLIINNIRKHIKNGFDDESIAEFLKQLLSFFLEKIAATKQTNECINYRYARGFVNTLITTPYWRSWIKTINI